MQAICAVFVYGINALRSNVMGVLKYVGAAYILWLIVYITKASYAKIKIALNEVCIS